MGVLNEKRCNVISLVDIDGLHFLPFLSLYESGLKRIKIYLQVKADNKSLYLSCSSFLLYGLCWFSSVSMHSSVLLINFRWSILLLFKQSHPLYSRVLSCWNPSKLEFIKSRTANSFVLHLIWNVKGSNGNKCWKQYVQ